MTADALPQCRKCHRPMRPKHCTIGEFPGTVQRGAHGLCHSHYLDERPKIRPAGGRHEPGRQVRAYHEYQYIVADRRRRGIPPEGLRSGTRISLATS